MQKISGHFIADGSAMTLNLGFIPDYAEFYVDLGDGELCFKFFRILATLATSGQYGIAIGNDGAISACADANNGFAIYEGSKKLSVRLPHPDGDGLTVAPIYGNYDATADYSSVGAARTITSVGTIVRPTTHNGYVYELITTASGTDTEPTWPTVPGETVDAGYHVWICREENLVQASGLGITIGATISTNGDIWCYSAERHDEVKNRGDAGNTDPI